MSNANTDRARLEAEAVYRFIETESNIPDFVLGAVNESIEQAARDLGKPWPTFDDDPNTGQDRTVDVLTNIFQDTRLYPIDLEPTADADPRVALQKLLNYAAGFPADLLFNVLVFAANTTSEHAVASAILDGMLAAVWSKTERGNKERAELMARIARQQVEIVNA